MKRFYAVATLIGTVIPYFYFYQQLANSEIGLVPIINAIFATYASTGFVADLFIASFIFWIYIYKKVNIKLFFTIVGLNLVIGLSAALPFYLYKTYKE
jgi:hypothetical protein